VQVNNAAVLFKTWDADAWNTTMATNFKGALDLTLALAPHLAPGALVTMVSSSE
jgi:NAD(P)-dependent dehydrogenase (short-subunit alcohol dehydrogenase family)